MKYSKNIINASNTPVFDFILCFEFELLNFGLTSLTIEVLANCITDTTPSKI